MNSSSPEFEGEGIVPTSAFYSNSNLESSEAPVTCVAAENKWNLLLEEDEESLSENLSVDEFVEELGKLLEKLRVIEEMMKSGIAVEENVEDELSKHVVCYNEALVNAIQVTKI